MAHARRIATGRNEQEVNRLLDNDSARNMHIGSIFEKRGVQRAEGIAMDIHVARELSLNLDGILSDFFRKIANSYAARNLINRRQITGKAPIDEYQPASNRRQVQRCNLLAGYT